MKSYDVFNILNSRDYIDFAYCSKVPAYLNIVDIAGLVKGAHEGKGLGNAFLSNISACDGIFHVVSTYCLVQMMYTVKLTYNEHFDNEFTLIAK